MAKSYSKGEYVPKNVEKVFGKRPIIYRSSWEMSLMRVFDENPAVLQWSSESITVPYQNPLTGKWTMYLPDFFVIYIDKNNQKHAEIIEIKPWKEDPRNPAKASTRTKLTQAINGAKWAAAAAYCRKRGWGFRVMTENQLFGIPGKKKQ